MQFMFRGISILKEESIFDQKEFGNSFGLQTQTKIYFKSTT